MSRLSEITKNVDAKIRKINKRIEKQKGYRVIKLKPKKRSVKP